MTKYPNLVVRLIGQDTVNTEEPQSYRELFQHKYADNPGILKRVEFAGLVDEDELYQAYAHCDLFCAPSRFESLGLVLIEAMMAGKPVVATAVGGMKEVVQDNGLLAEPGSAESLRSCLETLIKDAELRARMGHRSRQLFEDHWSLELATDRTVAGYLSIASNATGLGIRVDEHNLLERLMMVIEEAERMDRGSAQRTAQALLDRSCYPFDVRSELHRIWQVDDREFIDEIYRLLLNRSPDEAGLERNLFRLKTGVGRAEIARTILHSTYETASYRDDSTFEELLPADEFTSAYSYPLLLRSYWDRSHSEFVEALYGMFLGRVPDSDGLSSYVNRLAQGTRRSEIVREIALSLEAHSCDGGDAWLLEISSWDEPAPSETGSVSLAGRSVAHLRSLTNHLKTTIGRRLNPASGWQGSGRLHSEPQAEIGTLSEQFLKWTSSFQDQLDGVEESHRALLEWIKILQKKLEALAMDVRERIPPQEPGPGLPEPYVPDQESYDRLVQKMGDSLQINLGSGEKPLPDYINVDARNLPGTDVVADIRRLPFARGSLTEISSSHLVEHFRAHQFATVILPYWMSLLKDGGILRIICPNGEELVKQAAQGDLAMEDFRTVMFGLQDYSGDDHLAMYTPALLTSVLTSAGFRAVEVVTESRQNGLCPEMEIVATITRAG